MKTAPGSSREQNAHTYTKMPPIRTDHNMPAPAFFPLLASEWQYRMSQTAREQEKQKPNYQRRKTTVRSANPRQYGAEYGTAEISIGFTNDTSVEI